MFYWASFAYAAFFPEHQLYATSVSNLVLGINGVIRWRPESIKVSPEERAWLDDLKQKRAGRGE